MPWQILELCSCSCCQLQQLLRVLPSCAGDSLRLKDFMICTFMEIIFRIRFTASTFSLCVCMCVCARQQLKIFNYHGKKLSGNMHNISHMTREREGEGGGYPENSVRLVYLEAAKHFLLFRSCSDV